MKRSELPDGLPSTSATVGVGVVTFCVLGTLAAVSNVPELSADVLSLNSAYGHIARALAADRGFADPFGVPSGPTAWMPPLLPWLMSLMLRAFNGAPVPAGAALLGVQTAGWAVCATLVHRLVAPRLGPRYGWLAAALLVACALLFDRYFLRMFHDMWLTGLAMMLVLSALCAPVRTAPTTHVARLGRILPWALLPLISPILTAAAAACLIGLLLARRDGRRSAVWWPAAALAMMVLATIVWGTRNHAVLGQFVPTKSNLWFDFHQANVQDDDGVISASTFVRFHPFANERERRRFARLGETAYLAPLRDASLAAVRDDPLSYIHRVRRRAVSAFVLLRQPTDRLRCRPDVSSRDRERLLESVLYAEDERGLRCLFLALTPAAAEQTLGELQLDAPEAALASWLGAREVWVEARRRPIHLARGLALTALPLASVVLVLVVRRHADALFGTAAGLAVLYLAPYVLITHYPRYQIALAPLAALLVTYAVASVANRPSEGQGTARRARR